MTDYASYSWKPKRPDLGNKLARYDDIWFNDALLGWAINAEGRVLRTDDGGDTWVEQLVLPGYYLRCIAFADDQVGWLGCTGEGDPIVRLFRTSDGGKQWEPIKNLPPGTSPDVCGMWVFDRDTMIVCGSNRPQVQTTVTKTKDGGETWTVLDLKSQAASLIDIYFKDKDNGWITGGVDNVRCSGMPPSKPGLVPVVLRTTDGGDSWTKITNTVESKSPRGEWGWKIQRLPPATLIVSLQNYRDGSILRSDDDGATWRRLKINDRQRNGNLEGIGFLDPNWGWVGGWGNLERDGQFTSVTRDGGLTWDEDNAVLTNVNRFRMIGQPPTVAYAAGRGVYRFDNEPVAAAVADEGTAQLLVVEGPVEVTADGRDGDTFLVCVFEPASGMRVKLVADEGPADASRRMAKWDLTDDSGERVEPGVYFVRVVCGQRPKVVEVHVPSRPSA